MVNTRYKDLMENATDRLITRLRNAGHADLDSLSLELAVTVAADVIGLTESPVEGMMQRLESFFKPMPSASSSRLEKVTYSLLGNFRTLRFLFQDVRPAIASRRKQRREDVISHLLDEGYTQFEVLTECVTYAAAGMITTREFITMAGWHLLERPDLAAKFLRFRGQRVSRV
jgi:cytochrome P450